MSSAPTTILNEALKDANMRKDPRWTLRFTSQAILDHMDRLLVNIAHPLAYQPGRQDDRFCKLSAEGYQFDYLSDH